MIQLLRIKIELIRRKFGIYGLFNIVSLALVIFAVLAVEKLCLMSAGHYSQLVFWLMLFYFALFSGMLTKERRLNLRESIFFNCVDQKSVLLFERYYRFFFYEIFYFLFFFPVAVALPGEGLPASGASVFHALGEYLLGLTGGNAYGQAFWASFSLQQLLLAVLFWLRRRLSSERFVLFQGSLSVWVSLAGLAAARKPGLVPDFSMWPIKALLPLYAAGGIALLHCVYSVGKTDGTDGGECCYFVGITQKAPFLEQDQGLLLLVRRMCLPDALFILLLTGAEAPAYVQGEMDILYGYALSFAAAQIYLFLEIMRAQQKTLLFLLYTGKVRRQAAISACKTAPLLFAAACLGNWGRVSVGGIFCAGAAGVGGAFLVTAFLSCRTKKATGGKEWLSGWKTAGFYAAGALFSLLLMRVMCVNLFG